MAEPHEAGPEGDGEEREWGEREGQFKPVSEDEAGEHEGLGEGSGEGLSGQ